MNPTVLVTTTSRWYPTARLTMALANAGCTVDVVCPAGHPLRKTKAARHAHAYRGLAPQASIAQAIAVSQPDFIVSGDDLATQHLHRLYAEEQSKGADSQVCALIERSLGNPRSFPIVSARAAFMDVAVEQKVRVPSTQVVRNLDELRDWIARTGFPVVLKANGTSGGEGVKIVRTLAEAERCFARLQAPPLLARAVKRAVVDHDKTLLLPSIMRRRSVVNTQVFIAGHEATSTFVCWKGTVLASLHFEVINKVSTTGFATVVRLIENSEMAFAVEALARRLDLSGFYGFDFMVEANTGHAYLIEVNPRSTQVGHLGMGPGRDLPAALYSALSGKSVQAPPRVTEKDTVALFPQEWIRDSESPFLRTAYHDVPWEEPALVRDCVSSRKKRSAWYSRDRKQASTIIPEASPVATPTESSAVGLRGEVSRQA